MSDPRMYRTRNDYVITNIPCFYSTSISYALSSSTCRFVASAMYAQKCTEADPEWWKGYWYENYLRDESVRKRGIKTTVYEGEN